MPAADFGEKKKNSRVVVITSKFHKTWSISMTVGHDEVAGPTGQWARHVQRHKDLTARLGLHCSANLEDRDRLRVGRQPPNRRQPPDRDSGRSRWAASGRPSVSALWTPCGDTRKATPPCFPPAFCRVHRPAPGATRGVFALLGFFKDSRQGVAGHFLLWTKAVARQRHTAKTNAKERSSLVHERRLGEVELLRAVWDTTL